MHSGFSQGIWLPRRSSTHFACLGISTLLSSQEFASLGASICIISFCLSRSVVGLAGNCRRRSLCFLSVVGVVKGGIRSRPELGLVRV